MTDPRNNNPFATDSHDVRNEYDANRELVITATGVRLEIPADAFDPDPWNEWGTHDRGDDNDA